MERFEPFFSLAVALVVGLLIGFEREQSAPDDPEEHRLAFLGGARTHPLVALLGALSMLASHELGYGAVLVAFASVAALVGAAYVDMLRRGADRGITSEIAFLVTFWLGALAVSKLVESSGRRAIIVLSIAIAVTLVLSVKPRLHAIAARARKDDVFATLKFLIVAVIVLPLLPNRTLDPYEVINPFKIGLMVVLIAGIDFVGYVAVRILGPGRGLGVTGLVGGLASSTAVTLSVSNRAKEEPELASACALATVTASTIMMPRVLIEVGLVHAPLLSSLWIPLGAMSAAGGAAIFVLYRRSRSKQSQEGHDLELDNPFELSSALKWGLVFTAVLFVATLAHQKLGQSGSYLAGLLAGTTDVDAITLSMANLAKGGSVAAPVAVTTIIIGSAANTIVKAGIATVIGGWAYGRLVAASFLLMLLAGAAGLAAVWLT